MGSENKSLESENKSLVPRFDVLSKLINEVYMHPVLYDPQDDLYKDNQARQRAWAEISKATSMPVASCQIRWGSLRRCLSNARNRQNRKIQAGSKFIKKWRYQDQMSFLDAFCDRRELEYVGDRKKSSRLQNSVENITITDSNVNANCSHEIFMSEDYADGDENLTIKPEIYTINSSPKQSDESERRDKTGITTSLLIEEDVIDGLHTPDAQDQSHCSLSNSNNNKLEITAGNILLDEMDTFFLGMARSLKKLPIVEQIKVRSLVYNAITDAEIKWLTTGANSSSTSSG